MGAKWRAEFKRRLHKAVETRWGSVYKAVTARAASVSLNRWTQQKGGTLPNVEALWELCARGGLSADYLLFGRGPVLAPDVPVAFEPVDWKDKRHALSHALLWYAQSVALERLHERVSDVALIEESGADSSTAPDLSDFSSTVAEQAFQRFAPTLKAIDDAIRADTDRQIDEQLAALYKRTHGTARRRAK